MTKHSCLRHQQTKSQYHVVLILLHKVGTISPRECDRASDALYRGSHMDKGSLLPSVSVVSSHANPYSCAHHRT